jgi:hypothetical protein
LEERKKRLEERRISGAFYYRFQTGESGADVTERVKQHFINFLGCHFY